MASESPRARHVQTWLWAFAVGASTPLSALAQETPLPGSIYTCVDNNGNRLTSDRPIPSCNDRDQKVLNRDGSLQRIIQRQLTADERAAKEAVDRKAAADRNSQREAVRSDRLMMQRYPDESAHLKSRALALDPLNIALAESRKRLADLAVERKPLLDEGEFYKGKALPPKLKQQIDANDAAQEAQRSLISRAETEIVRVNTIYDIELARLRKLWGGADPGSMGPLPKQR